MADYVIKDALTGSELAFADDGDVAVVQMSAAREQTESLFLPGCSFINYGMPLVNAVYDTLREAGKVSGITLICCGKILSYEADGKARRARHEQDLRQHLLDVGVKRIVCACPNCVKALRSALAADEATASIEVVPLVTVLAELGYQLDPAVVAEMVGGDPSAKVLLCTHDSCPDRATGEFADGLRALIPEGLWADPAHCRKRSVCCGSLARAAGHFDVADRQAVQNGAEALEVGADCLVTACVSCAFQLNVAQSAVPARHVLEFLYQWPIAWDYADQYMKLRFLFEQEVEEEGGRAFMALENETVADRAETVEVAMQTEGAELGLADAKTREDYDADERAAGSVSISNRDVETVGE